MTRIMARGLRENTTLADSQNSVPGPTQVAHNHM